MLYGNSNSLNFFFSNVKRMHLESNSSPPYARPESEKKFLVLYSSSSENVSMFLKVSHCRLGVMVKNERKRGTHVHNCGACYNNCFFEVLIAALHYVEENQEVSKNFWASIHE